MEIEKLENPFIKVTWDDIPENFTQERIKRVRSYFKKKYNTNNVTVLTRSLDSKSGDEMDIDIEENVMDLAYQSKLMSQFVVTNDMGVDIELLKRLDDKVNAKMSDEMEVDTKYKRVYVKSIKFSNFLSFGDDNKLDVESLGGITVIDSNPPNFGGKSVLAVDLILFLFFNTTTKSSKAIEIFNRFKTNNNEVFVQGEVEIDGRSFTIIRKITRRKTKKGTWSVSTSLDFLEKRDDGSLENFTGEQRRETDKFIKESIGTMNDFLLTVLSTASNLESLIESKPTERGNILSRFIGLEILKDKEKSCKEMYSEWSKKNISNIYNVEDLKSDIESHNNEKDGLLSNNKDLNIVMNEAIDNLKVKNDERDKYISEKSSDIDSDAKDINPRLTQKHIDECTTKLEKTNKLLLAYGDKEKPESIDLIVLKDKKEERDELVLEKAKKGMTLKSSKKTIKELEESGICPLCKRSLEDVDHTEEIERLKLEITNVGDDIITLEGSVSKLEEEVELIENKKLLFDEYEKDMLKKERLVLEVYKNELEIEKLNGKLKKWKDNKEKIEKNEELEKKIMVINSEIDRITNTKDTSIRTIESNNNRCDVLDTQITEANTKIEKIKKETEVDKVFRAYLTVFGKNGIIKTIMKSVVPKLNNELMRLLTDVTNFMVEIRVNEKNEVEFWMVDNETQVEKLLSTGSGFEKTLASLAIRTVLTKVSCLPRPNITVFDEVLGKVSNENLDQVGVFFSRVKEYFENIFLITHNPLVREWADNNITIIKENNISKLK